MIEVRIEPITAEAVTPYGWMLGKSYPETDTVSAFTSPGSDFWQEHVFDVGDTGQPEVLWVKYRVADPVIEKLEVHRVTQQAVVPLIGSIIQIVATSDATGNPDLATVKAFILPPGVGICMKPGTWHATRTDGPEESTCLMLTRRSTTIDLVSHLVRKTPATESRLADVGKLRLSR